LAGIVPGLFVTGTILGTVTQRGQSRTILEISVIFFTCLGRLLQSNFHNSRDSAGLSDKAAISSPSKFNNSDDLTFRAFDIFSFEA
jgi:hypothetical protein